MENCTHFCSRHKLQYRHLCLFHSLFGGYLGLGVEVMTFAVSPPIFALCLLALALLGVPSLSEMKLTSPHSDGMAITCLEEWRGHG